MRFPRRAAPGMHRKAAHILSASKKFHSLAWISHGTNELTPHFLMCKLEDEK
jgi:hypothetical protein